MSELRITSEYGRNGRGFTLMEVLVVVVIIALLIGLVIGGMDLFRGKSHQAVVSALFDSVDKGLSRFRSEAGDFPPSDPQVGNEMVDKPLFATRGPLIFDGSMEGGEILAQAMMGAEPEEIDGVQGLGLKRKGDRRYGPYLDVGNSDSLVRTKAVSSAGKGRFVLTVPFSTRNRPILYYRRKANQSQKNFTRGGSSVWSQSGWFDTDDNRKLARNDDPVAYWTKDKKDGGPSRERSDAMAREMRAAPWLLVCAATDDTFGTKDDFLKTGYAQ